MSFSKYPDQIDTSDELPPTIDNVTPVRAEVVNRLRDAMLAVESELGVDPSRTYGTVRARLDDLERLLRSLIERLDEISAGFGGSPTERNKNMSPMATSGDGSSTGLTLAETPIGNRYVTIIVNGVSNSVGDGVKTRDCYFSRNGGSTALSLINLRTGDVLFWNAVISGIELVPSDIVDFDYDV